MKRVWHHLLNKFIELIVKFEINHNLNSLINLLEIVILFKNIINKYHLIVMLLIKIITRNNNFL